MNRRARIPKWLIALTAAGAALVLLATGAAIFNAGPGDTGTGNDAAAHPGATVRSSSANGSAAPSTPGPTATTTAASSAKPGSSKAKLPDNPPVKPSGDHPNAATTGVPAGTKLTTLTLNSGGAYRVSQSGTVLNAVHIPGDLLITATNVTIKNSQIDGGVLDEYSGKTYSFTISDSTVGPATGCNTLPGVGEADYTATRVHVRGHGDGFRASGNNVNIQDSYVYLCSNPGDHSDGIQTYLTGRGLVLNHTTIDQRNVKDYTAPIFIVDNQTVDVSVTNNLVMGGTYTIQVKNARGSVVVHNNMVVNKSWDYGPVEAECSVADWSGNALVTIDSNYRVTSIVSALPCAS